MSSPRKPRPFWRQARTSTCLTKSMLRGPAVVMTWAPLALASCTPKEPTPPAPAWISTRWPVCTPAASSDCAQTALMRSYGAQTTDLLGRYRLQGP